MTSGTKPEIFEVSGIKLLKGGGVSRCVKK